MRMLYGPLKVLRERGSHERRKNGPGCMGFSRYRRKVFFSSLALPTTSTIRNTDPPFQRSGASVTGAKGVRHFAVTRAALPAGLRKPYQNSGLSGRAESSWAKSLGSAPSHTTLRMTSVMGSSTPKAAESTPRLWHA